MTGVVIKDEQSVSKAAAILIEAGVTEIVVSLGDKGSYYADQAGSFIHTPAYQVQVVDTTAAGDTFIGAYIVERTLGKSAKMSLQFATAAAALAVMKDGAQKSIPFQQQIRDEINVHNSKN